MMNEIKLFIESFGFPIFCCVVLSWYLHKNTKEAREDRINAMLRHGEERKYWSEKNSEDRKEMTDAIKSLERSVLRNNR